MLTAMLILAVALPIGQPPTSEGPVPVGEPAAATAAQWGPPGASTPRKATPATPATPAALDPRYQSSAIVPLSQLMSGPGLQDLPRAPASPTSKVATSASSGPTGPELPAPRTPVATSGPIVQASAREVLPPPTPVGPALPGASSTPTQISSLPPLQDPAAPTTSPMPAAAPADTPYAPTPRASWTEERKFSGLGWAIVPGPQGPGAARNDQTESAKPMTDSTLPMLPPPSAPAVMPAPLPSASESPVPSPSMLPPPTRAATTIATSQPSTAIPPTLAKPPEKAKPPETAKPIASTEPKPALPATPSGAVPVIQLDTIGPATVTQGAPITYEIIARNKSAAAAINLHIEDELPAGAQFLSADPKPENVGDGEHAQKLAWSLPSLEAGGERHFKVTIHPTASATEFQSNATATFSVASSLHTQVTQPRLALTQTGPESVALGQPAAFKVQITNKGTGPATHVILRERLPAGLKHPQGADIEAELGTLAPGATRNITLQTTAVRGGKQTIEAFVSADEGVKSITQCSATVSEPSLYLHMTGPGRRLINREAEFELEVINSGTGPATGIEITDTLPAGFDFVSANQSAKYDGSARAVNWTVGSLAPGQKKALGLKVIARSAGDLVNRAVVHADNGLEAKADASVHCEGIPALMLEVVDLDDPVEVGSETTYEIRVLNQGTAPSTGIRISCTVPAGMSVKDAAGPVPFHVQQKQVVFEPVRKLAAHADCLFRIRVVGKEPGDWRFRTQLTCDQLRTPVNKEESTRVYQE